MRIILSIALSAFLLIGQVLAAEQQETKQGTLSQKEKLSYSLGYKTGSNMKNNSVDIDLDIYTKAFKEGFAGDKAAMTDPEMLDAIQAFQKEIKAKQPDKKKELGEKNKQIAEKNKELGEAFLAENAKKEGVVTLPSGVQYKVIKEGAGKQPAKTDKVTIHYRGTLINGAEFHNTYKGDKPAINDVGKFIRGMTEGLQLMKEGSKWMLYIPSHLAYGAQGLGRGKNAKARLQQSLVGPNQTLIFEVELVAIQ